MKRNQAESALLKNEKLSINHTYIPFIGIHEVPNETQKPRKTKQRKIKQKNPALKFNAGFILDCIILILPHIVLSVYYFFNSS